VALALYRKYRPRTFAEVIGQEHVTEPLSQALRSGRLNHAYLFSGPRGCGKTSSARILARSLNCEQGPTPEPCGQCASCRSLAVDGAGSIDVIEIDAASHGGVDDARDLREKAFCAPASSRYKIYVIDEAHMVSTQGFNALLKLVEEPPDYVKFIFATTEPEKVLGTIRSRTHHYPFRLIPPATLRPYLAQLCEAEGVHVDPAVFPLVVRAGGGSARDSLSILDQLIAGAGPDGVGYARAVALLGVTDTALIDEMCDALAAGDGAAAYATIDRVAEAGHDPRRFAADLLERLRDLIIMQQVPDAVAKGLIDGPTDAMERMTGQAGRLGPATLSRCADIVHNGLVEMRGTTAPRLLLELITARMLLPGAEDSTGALLQRLERMERRLTLGDGAAGHASADNQTTVRPTPAPATPQAPAPPPSPVPAPTPAAPSVPVGSTTPSTVGVSTPPTSPAAAPPNSPSQSGPTSAGAASGATDRDGREGSGWAGAPAAVATATSEAPRAPVARRPEPSAVMPDPPSEVSAVASGTGVPGQLSAAGIRDAWPEIVAMVGRKSKKIAALAQGATVQDLDGQTVVLGFRFPAHARMVAAQPELLSDALYETLGGRWQIRCDIAGDGVAAAPVRTGAAAQARSVPQAAAQPGAAQPGAAQSGVQPGGTLVGSSQPGGAQGGSSQAGSAEAASDWPEAAQPYQAPPQPAQVDAAGVTAGGTGAEHTDGAANGASYADPLPAVDTGSDWPEPARPGGFAAPEPRPAPPPAVAGGGGAAGGGVAPRTAGNGRAAGASAALAAARAAAAAGGSGARPAAVGGTWSDGSPAEEPPYDPEYDGPVRAGGPAGAGATIEGFDPGDEPLDDVIDEKTARQSSEQQAVQLLRDAFGGAEKIGES
jgi:DNA polymerase-3 subunit gamma/tau